MDGGHGRLVCVDEILLGDCHNAPPLGKIVLIGEGGNGPPVGFEKVPMLGHADVWIEIGDHGERVSYPGISIKDKP